jgi:hypothetical protein
MMSSAQDVASRIGPTISTTHRVTVSDSWVRGVPTTSRVALLRVTHMSTGTQSLPRVRHPGRGGTPVSGRFAGPPWLQGSVHVRSRRRVGPGNQEMLLVIVFVVWEFGEHAQLERGEALGEVEPLVERIAIVDT